MWRSGRIAIGLLMMPVVAYDGRVAAGETDPDIITGAELVTRIEAAEDGGIDVDVNDLTVTGEVDLGRLRTIDRPLRCVRCTFEGPIVAADVVFTSIVELVDVTFEGPVDARGAIFERSAVFDGSEFRSGLDMSSARFGALASFVAADVHGAAAFDRAEFAGRAVFTGALRGEGAGPPGPCSAVDGAFGDIVGFGGASFEGPALFRQRCFAGAADFGGVSFAATADFTLTEHHAPTGFQLASFAAEGAFNVARFSDSVSFEAASLGGQLDFDGAQLDSTTVFSSLSGTGSLVLDGVILSEGADRPLRLTGVTLDGLSMELAQVPSVRGPAVQVEVLELLEMTARERGDTGFANDVRYELLTRRNGELGQPRRFFDRVFYGSIGGYLVRPTRPLFWLAALTLAGAIARALSWWRRSMVARRRPVPFATQLSVGFFRGLSKTLAATWNVKDPPALDVETDGDTLAVRPYLIIAVRWVEWLAVKVLIAVALLGIANANPTIRELVDSVF